MSRHRCCCGHIASDVCELLQDTRDYPSCLEVSISGVSSVTGCISSQGNQLTTRIAFSGVNRSLILDKSSSPTQPPGLPVTYFGTVPVYVSYRISGSNLNYKHVWTTMPVLLTLRCDDGRLGVSSVEASIDGIKTDTGGISFYQLFALSLETQSPLPRIGETFTTLGTTPVCLGSNSPLETIIAGVSRMTVRIPASCQAQPYLVEADECDGDRTIIVDLEDYPAGVADLAYPTLDDIVYVPTDRAVLGPKTPGVIWVETDCDVDLLVNKIATKCSDPSVQIVYDPAMRTQDGVTVDYQGDKYNPTDEQTSDPSVPVVWSPDPCPGQFFKAIFCSASQSGTTIPSDGAGYAVAPGMQPGEGSIRYTFSDPGPSGGTCNHTIYLQPTTVPADYEFDGFTQIPGLCSTGLSGRTGDCFNGTQPPIEPVDPNFLMAPPDNPLKKKGMVSEAELDAMGASPEQVALSLKQGGCCDPPRQI